MKWLLLILILFLVGCTKTFDDYDFHSCSEGDECVVVRGMGCCECFNVINVKYEDIWYDRFVSICQEVCEPCGAIPTGAKCVENTCVPDINNFEECIAAGYPAMESYPRQCAVPGWLTFTEVI